MIEASDALPLPRREARRRLSLEITEQIYDAAVQPLAWQDVVDALSRACGGAAVAAALRIATPGVPSEAYRRYIDPALSGVLNRHLATGLPWTSPMHPRYSQQFVRGSEYFPDSQLPSTEFYKEYMEPQGLAPEAPIAFNLQGEERSEAAIVLYRRVGCRPIDHADMELLNSLVPHLSRAHHIYSRLHGERDQRRALAEVIDRFPMGVLLVDAKGRCISVNASAERILGLKDGFALEHERPTLSDDRDEEAFQSLIATASAEAARAPGKAMRVIAVERPSGGPAFSMSVIPLLMPDTTSGENLAVAAVFVADPNAGRMSLSVLRELYKFTPAEAELVSHLVTGASLEEISRLRGIKISTARGYLKSIYRKSQTNSQRELVRLMLTGVGPIAEPKPRRD